MKVLRICLTLPSEEVPGAGQPCYYHSWYSNHDEMIITLKGYKHKPVRQGVKLVEIDVRNSGLGKFEDSFLTKIKNLLTKTSEQLTFLLKSRKYVREFKPDIVHVYTPMPILLGLWTKWKFGSKLVLSLHGTDVLRIKSSKIYHFCLEKPDAVVTVEKSSEAVQEEFKHLKLKRPIESIGNGVDLSTFKDLHLERKNQFIQVASFKWQKGKVYLLNGFAEFLKKHPYYNLVLVGEGKEEDKAEIKKLSIELGIESYVIYKGMLSREEVAQEMSISKAFVLTSLMEGLPKVVLEAMATGTPVISTSICSIPEIIMDAGVIIPVKDSKAVCQAMEIMVSSTSQWEDFSKKSLEYVKEYSWEHVEDRLNAVYYSLTGGEPKQQ